MTNHIGPVYVNYALLFAFCFTFVKFYLLVAVSLVFRFVVFGFAYLSSQRFH